MVRAEIDRTHPRCDSSVVEKRKLYVNLCGDQKNQVKIRA